MSTADFEDWYRNSYRPVLASLSVLAGDRDLGREATDEAFARAYAAWHRVGSMSSPSGWVFRVALNVVRRRQRRRGLESRLLARHRPTRELGPASTELWMLVGSLPARQRTAIVLRYLADLSEADVARAMGIARGTASSTLAAATGRLHNMLSEDSDRPGRRRART